ncbi:MAG: hypothetical protein WCJ21_12540 [Planctomycetota bacterium]
MSSPDSNANNSPDASDGSRAGLDPLEALTRSPQVLQVLTALVDSVNAQRGASETRDAQMEASLSDFRAVFEQQMRLLRNALATRAGPASVAEPVSRQVLQMERSMLWTWETTRDSKSSRLPRPSIIGRALSDLQQSEGTTYDGSSPADIYITILVSGRHHLSDVAVRRVERYQAGATRAMSGKINEHLEPRFDALSIRRDGRNYAENVGDRRSLTARGCRVFENWPHWDARDDDPTGDGPGTSGSAPPAGATDAT